MDKEKLKFKMPLEQYIHQGTWLQWPHNYTLENGEKYRESLEHIWIELTRHLVKGEEVHIIAYDSNEQLHIEEILKRGKINMDKVYIHIYPTDDVWVRDNGPIFLYNHDDQLVLADWGFNGWGGKVPYEKDKQIPTHISRDLCIPRIDLKQVVLEGGAVELDGNGTMLATKSSIINENRNPNVTIETIEKHMKQYFGAKQCIWLDGVIGADITDMHIDLFAKFSDQETLVTMKKEELIEAGMSEKDSRILLGATNIQGNSYNHIYLPLTKQNIVLANGIDIGRKGSYVNYYIGNQVVLVPNYQDANDNKAMEILKALYPYKEVIGIDVRELYPKGGMLHCVTQQQPITEVNISNSTQYSPK